MKPAKIQRVLLCLVVATFGTILGTALIYWIEFVNRLVKS